MPSPEPGILVIATIAQEMVSKPVVNSLIRMQKYADIPIVCTCTWHKDGKTFGFTGRKRLTAGDEVRRRW